MMIKPIHRIALTLTLGIAAISLASLAQAQETLPLDRTRLPLPEPRFQGTIGTTYLDSKSAWPQLPTPPSGAPNVVIILLDDVGFGQVSTFGGPVPTPNLDKLAAQGLRYTRFHTTAICGPSRAALITGRNHHNAGSGFSPNGRLAFPATTT
jgi:arylsulfatase